MAIAGTQGTAPAQAGPLEETVAVAGQQPVAQQTANPDIELARNEYARLRSNVETAFTELGNEVTRLSESLRNEGKVLGSRGLFKLVSRIAHAIESICHLEQGRLTSRLVGDTPFSRGLDRQRTAIGPLERAIGEFDGTLTRLGGKPLSALSAAERAEVRAQLDAVENKVDEFQSTINYFDADTEEREHHLRGFNDLALNIHTSLSQYRERLDLPLEEVASLEGGVMAEEAMGSDSGITDFDSSAKEMDDNLKRLFDETRNLAEEIENEFNKLLADGENLLNQISANKAWFANALENAESRRQTPPEQPTEPNAASPQAAPSASAAAVPKPSHGNERDKLAIIPPNQNFVDARSYHNEITTGQPEGTNPLFYREKQEARQCMKHSMNAFLGGPFVSSKDFVPFHREGLVNGQLETILASPAAYARDNQLNEAEVRADPRKFAEMAAAQWAEIDPDAFDSENAVLAGQLLEWGLKWVNGNHERLGVPEAVIEKFGRHDDPRQILDFAERKQGQVDRMVVGAGSHYQAFRQAADGDWFIVDSRPDAVGNGQERQSPLDFIRHRLELERETPEANGANNGGARFEFLTFDAVGPVEPRFGPQAMEHVRV